MIDDERSGRPAWCDQETPRHAFAVSAFTIVSVNPQAAGGLGRAVGGLPDPPAGASLLVAVAIGLVMLGAYRLAEAKWRRA